MRTVGHLVAAWSVLTIIAAICMARGAGGKPFPPPLLLEGIPRDIDFVKLVGSTQVVLQASPTEDLISFTRNDALLRILLLALALRKPAAVEYVEGARKVLTSAALALNTSQDDGQVQLLAFDEKDNYCRARIMNQGQPVDVWTDSGQVQAILETGAREGIPVGIEFAEDTKQITRAKVNVEQQPGK
jgi:hypothetical protein